MKKDNTYTEKDIIILSDREHVRMRTQIYLGNMKKTSYSVPLFTDDGIVIDDVQFIPAVYKAVNEVTDNSIDELTQVATNHPKVIKISAQPLLGVYEVSDSGRGVPINMHEVGKHTPEVVFGQLRSGRNFGDEKEVGVIGQNGVGSACTNYCSTEFSVDIHRSGKRYRQKFTDGATHVSKPSIKRQQGARTTGTSVSFQLDSEVFDDISLPLELIKNRAIEIALTNPGFMVEYNDKKYKFKKGFEDLVKKISKEYFKFEFLFGEFYVIFDAYEGPDEQMFSWVNSSLLFDGGLCNTQFLNAFFSKTIQHLDPAAKKQKCKVAKDDIIPNLLILGNLKISDPEYDAQSKTRLTGPNLRMQITDAIFSQWGAFARKNKSWFDEVLEHAMVRHHVQADRKAIKDHEKNLRKRITVPGLLDATSTTRSTCQLLVTEGDSASGMVSEVRNPETTGTLPLRGKINNVFGTTVAQLLKMGKTSDLITAIGLVPGQKAIRSNLRYGKIVIATDADYDGADIFTLLINLFYQFWKELFDPDYQPIIYRLMAPNVVASKGNKRIHFITRADFERKKGRYKGYTIDYLKGLGSMEQQDWEMILTGKTDTLIPIVDDGNMKETLQLLFGPNTDARKEWLQ